MNSPNLSSFFLLQSIVWISPSFDLNRWYAQLVKTIQNDVVIEPRVGAYEELGIY